ncbi:carboxypeptidase-like regulatory domain-containing protein [Flavobacterium sp. UBA4197]|uniref:carboxypeptidase-like regulatory domain-containing protein n=1 Tax=Flavobacterium sp. UBA4197 TaxID=1946546 RepID=UPI00257FD7C3|nr:carboxypeptidase-like regulatory domain-containing protein [Flavobacterium sp. UBA4197]
MDTEKILILFISFFFSGFIIVKAQGTTQRNTITISGKVTDFNGNPIDSSVVRLNNARFEPIYETYTDKEGNYKLENVRKGNYKSMFVMRPKEYPRANEVSKDKMRLEFWAWNVVAKEDLIINPHYDKLEVYGTTVYETFGGTSGFFIYFRPMSLKKVLAFSEFTDKSKSEKHVDVSIKPENLRIKVYAGNELLKTNSIQSIKEYTGENNYPITAYIVQVDKPKQIKDNSSFTIFRVEAENTAFNEKGESLFFYEPKIFE